MKIRSILTLLFISNILSVYGQTFLDQDIDMKKEHVIETIRFSDKNPPTEEKIKNLNSSVKKHISVYLRELKSVPASFWNIKNVLHLDLDIQGLSDIPNEIGKMKQLKSIDFSCHSLKALPNEFGNLTKLEYIEIRTEIDTFSFPNSITNLDKIISIKFTARNLKKINGPFFNSKETMYLTLRCKPLAIFPKNIYLYESLVEAKIEGSFIEISPDIGNLKNLRKIDLSIYGEKPSLLPENIFNFPKAVKFALKIKYEKNLPKKIINLSALRSFDLMVFDLKNLPQGIEKCHRLFSLEISSSKLKQLPSELSQLKQLSYIGLGLHSAKNLPTFNFESNTLERIAIWADKNQPLNSTPLNQFPNLTRLELSYVNMKFEHFSSCKKLETIGLFGSNWTTIPEGLLEFKNLNYLSFNTSKIENLPSFIDQFKEGLTIILNANPVSKKRDKIDLSNVKAKIAF